MTTIRGSSIYRLSAMVRYTGHISKEKRLAHGFFLRQINLALDEGKDIIPIYLEKVELTSDLKVGLSRLQALFNDDVNYYQHLLNALGEGSTTAVSTPTLSASHPTTWPRNGKKGKTARSGSTGMK